MANIHFHIGEYQFILNELPNNPGHFISIHFDDRLGGNETFRGCIYIKNQQKKKKTKSEMVKNEMIKMYTK